MDDFKKVIRLEKELMSATEGISTRWRTLVRDHLERHPDTPYQRAVQLLEMLPF